MKSLKQKFEILKGLLMDELGSNEIKIGIALCELQFELEKFREIEIYKEDYSDSDWSFMLNNDKLKRFTAYTKED